VRTKRANRQPLKSPLLIDYAEFRKRQPKKYPTGIVDDIPKLRAGDIAEVCDGRTLLLLEIESRDGEFFIRRVCDPQMRDDIYFPLPDGINAGDRVAFHAVNIYALSFH
jgi:hypothetical protein